MKNPKYESEVYEALHTLVCSESRLAIISQLDEDEVTIQLQLAEYKLSLTGSTMHSLPLSRLYQTINMLNRRLQSLSRPLRAIVEELVVLK